MSQITQLIIFLLSVALYFLLVEFLNEQIRFYFKKKNEEYSKELRTIRKENESINKEIERLSVIVEVNSVEIAMMRSFIQEKLSLSEDSCN